MIISVIMPMIKCVTVRDSKACCKEYSEGIHDLCVIRCPCVSPLFVYDPETCVKCLDHVKFFKTLGNVDCLSQHLVCLEKS